MSSWTRRRRSQIDADALYDVIYKPGGACAHFCRTARAVQSARRVVRGMITKRLTARQIDRQSETDRQGDRERDRQDKTGQDRTGQYWTGQYWTGQYWTGQDRRDRAGW